MFRILALGTILADFLYFYISYPNKILRFARILRACFIILYAKDMRRNLKGILKSGRSLLIIFILYLIIIFIWSYIGTQVIGDISNDVAIDSITNLFKLLLFF